MFNEFLVYSKEKEENEKQSRIFSLTLSHSRLVIGWIGVGRSINISKIFEMYKNVKSCIVFVQFERKGIQMA